MSEFSDDIFFFRVGYSRLLLIYSQHHHQDFPTNIEHFFITIATLVSHYFHRLGDIQTFRWTNVIKIA